MIPIVEHVVHRSPDLASRGLLTEHHAIEKANSRSAKHSSTS